MTAWQIIAGEAPRFFTWWNIAFLLKAVRPCAVRCQGKRASSATARAKEKPSPPDGGRGSRSLGAQRLGEAGEGGCAQRMVVGLHPNSIPPSPNPLPPSGGEGDFSLALFR
jgi:hypothetical protein